MDAAQPLATPLTREPAMQPSAPPPAMPPTLSQPRTQPLVSLVDAMPARDQSIPDPLVQCGVRRPAKCTDATCCLIFLAALVGAAVVGGIGFAKGNPAILQRFTSGTDSQGRVCGVDDGVKDFKLTYFTLPLGHAPVMDASGHRSSFTLQLQKVCTKECPHSDNVNQDEQKPTGPREAGLCADASACTWYGGDTTRSGKYCVDKDVFQNTINAGLLLQDLKASWKVLLCVPFLSIIFGAIYLFCVRRCVGVCLALAVIVSVVIPAAIGTVIFLKSDNISSLGHHLFDNMTPQSIKYVAYGFWSAAAILLLVTLCCIGALRSAVEVLKTTTEFLSDVPSQMFQPLIIGVFQLLFFVAWVPAFIAVGTIGAKAGDQQQCLKDGDMYCVKWDGSKLQWLTVYLVFILYWGLNFIHAVSHFGTSYAAGCWYFADVDPESGRRMTSGQGGKGCCDCRLTLKGLFHGVVTHPGSLAFGAFCIALARFVRLLLAFAEKSTEAERRNILVAVLRCVMHCAANCVERFIKFIAEHAYIEIALSGHGFCSSAMRAMHMAAKKPALFLLVGRVAHAIRVLGVGLIVVCTTCVVLLWMAKSPPSGLHSTVPAIVVSVIASFVMAEVMMHPFTASARAVLHCLVTDEEQAQKQGLSEASRAPGHLKALAAANCGDVAARGRCCGLR